MNVTLRTLVGNHSMYELRTTVSRSSSRRRAIRLRNQGEQALSHAHAREALHCLLHHERPVPAQHPQLHSDSDTSYARTAERSQTLGPGAALMNSALSRPANTRSGAGSALPCCCIAIP